MLGEFPVEHGPKEANTAVNPDVSAGVKTSADSPGAARDPFTSSIGDAYMARQCGSSESPG
jgi:hypothetical protein